MKYKCINMTKILCGICGHCYHDTEKAKKRHFESAHHVCRVLEIRIAKIKINHLLEDLDKVLNLEKPINEIIV